MSYASDNGAKTWAIHGDLTDGTVPRLFEDCASGNGGGISINTTSPPAGHNRWISHIPTGSAQWHYDGNTASGISLFTTSSQAFAVCVRYLIFSALPSASVNMFLGTVAGLRDSSAYSQRRFRLRTDGKIDMLPSDEAVTIDTSVETLAHSTTYAVVAVHDNDFGGTSRTSLYYSTDGGATFTAFTWAGSGQAYVDYSDLDNPAGPIDEASLRLGSPLNNDNGIVTKWAEVGVMWASEWLGAVPLNFAVGKFAPNADVVAEWTLNSGTDHFAGVSKEQGTGGGGIKVSETVADQQEIFGYEASDTTKIPAANTALALKAWANLRGSSSLPDAANLTHLITDNGATYTYPSHDGAYSEDHYGGTQHDSSVSLATMPGGGGRWTPSRIDALEAGLDKVGDDALLYNCFQHWLTVPSISNPRSPDPVHPTLMGMSPAII